MLFLLTFMHNMSVNSNYLLIGLKVATKTQYNNKKAFGWESQYIGQKFWQCLA